MPQPETAPGMSRLRLEPLAREVRRVSFIISRYLVNPKTSFFGTPARMIMANRLAAKSRAQESCRILDPNTWPAVSFWYHLSLQDFTNETVPS